MKTGNHFHERCYQLLTLIPEGRVTTYKEIAKALNTNAWRAVGTAMANNKKLIEIPCHRVVRSDGAIGDYALGSDRKCELLVGEGVEVVGRKVKDLGRYLFRFDD